MDPDEFMLVSTKKCYRPVYEHEGKPEHQIRVIEMLGGITSNKDEVTCTECLSWIHA